jgi:hypothetical protein
MPLIQRDKDDFVLSAEHLAILAERIVQRRTQLALIPPPESASSSLQQELLDAYGQLDQESQVQLALALAVCQMPDKIADLHHTIADRTISRSSLAWSRQADGMIVALSRVGDQRRLNLWSPEQLADSIRSILAALATLRDDRIGCLLTTTSAVVFLAAVDQHKAVHLASMLLHTAPLLHFSAAELQERLQDAISEDFRWPLCFAEKLIPGNRVASLGAEQIQQAVADLVHAGLIEAAGAERYAFTDSGVLIADGMIQECAKVALAIRELVGPSEQGQDLLLLCRGPLHLFTVAFSGPEAIVAAVNSAELDGLLKAALRFPAQAEAIPDHSSTAEQPLAAATPPTLSMAAPPPRAEEWFYGIDGLTQGPVAEQELRSRLERGELTASTPVWTAGMQSWVEAREAGLIALAVASEATSPQRVCPHCGNALSGQARFCSGCGSAVTP